MLVLPNVIMELSNVRKKKQGIIKCDKRTIKCDVGTVNVTMKPSNVGKKNKRTIKCDKSTITCHVGTEQYEDETIKSEKKREPSNVTKKQSHVMLELHNMRMKPSTVRKK